MFLAKLSPPQQDAFLQLAAQLVAVDGEITPDELEMLSEIAMGATDWVPQDDLPIAGLVAAFDDTVSRRAALVELIGLAHADTVYGPEEREFIADLARRMSVSPARLAQLEAWVVRQLALTAEGLALLEDG